MGILRPGSAFAAALVQAGCYSPSLRDCTVSCASPNDCADGQICGDDGMCAAPELAGRCRRVGKPDGGPRSDAGLPSDATQDDAGSHDASLTVSLHVQIAGNGSVAVEDVGTCSSRDPQNGDCTYDVLIGVRRTARAIEIQPDHTFTRWTSLTCAGQDATCTFTPFVATRIAARFDHEAVVSAP